LFLLNYEIGASKGLKNEEMKCSDAAVPSAGAWRSRGGADGPASAAQRGATQSGFRGLGRAHAPLAIFGLLAGH